MKFIKLLPIILVFILPGCELVGPSVKVKGPKLILDDHGHEHDHKHGKKGHCPPGQAKKGRC